MPSTLSARDCLKIIDSSMFEFQFTCRSCGMMPYIISPEQRETFCNFCEGYVDLDGMDAVHGSADAEKNLQSMSAAAQNGKWVQGVPYADAIAATKDPFFLYGASHFYRFFSDITYYDVNYSLGGFMYSNADKRSDELTRNKYNAMALTSKSKEYLFKALKIISSTPSDARLTYLKFMCNIRLKRQAHASSALLELATLKDNIALYRYASMVLNSEHHDTIKKSQSPDAESALGSANIIYYTARHLARQGNLDGATKILSQLTKRIYMPIAESYNRKVINVSSALYL